MDENELREVSGTATDILAHFPKRIEQKENNTDGSGALPSATSMPIIADPGFRPMSRSGGEGNDGDGLTRRQERAERNFRYSNQLL